MCEAPEPGSLPNTSTAPWWWKQPSSLRAGHGCFGLRVLGAARAPVERAAAHLGVEKALSAVLGAEEAPV